MAERESQFITMTRQSIIVATAMGVGLLTFCYVIGVQVGKKSLTRQNARVKSLDEELKELGQPLDEQLKLFESIENNNQTTRNNRPSPNTPSRPTAPETQRPATISETPRVSTANQANQANQTSPTNQNTQPADTAATGERFTAQVIASREMSGATRVSEHLRSEGIATKIVSADGLYKVQLDWSGTRADLDPRVSRLQILGYQPMVVRVQ